MAANANSTYFAPPRAIVRSRLSHRLKKCGVGLANFVLAVVWCLQQLELTAALQPPHRSQQRFCHTDATRFNVDEMLSYVKVDCARLHPILA
jgi:hypothetical protein